MTGWRYPGWRMVGVAFVVDFLAVGFFFYSYGIFLKSIAADLGVSRLDVSFGLPISNAAGALLAPFIGRALDRHSIKRFMIAGALMLSAGFALLSRTASLWQFYLLLGTFLAGGMAMMGGLASSKLVANWFSIRRGTALGLATMGISLSGLMMPTAATWLVAELGWRTAFVVYAFCTLAVVIPLVSALVVDRPEELGLRPDDEPPAEPTDAAAPLEELPWSTRELIASRNFWAIGIAFGLVMSVLSAILIHIVPYATDRGISAYRAGLILSLAAGLGVPGKLIFGWLFDRVDARVALLTSLAVQALGLIGILLGDAYGWLLAGAAVFGFGMGGVIPLQGAIGGAAFGRASFGKAMGLLRPVQLPLAVIGVPLAGWIHDSSGGYAPAFTLFLGFYLAAAVIIGLLRLERPPVRWTPPVDGASVGETGLA
jgi:cyanate permease